MTITIYFIKIMPKIGLLDFHLDINKRLQVIANLDATICIKKKTVSEEI